MKIVDKSKDTMKFMDLKFGDIFKCDGLYCVKVENTATVSVVLNAVDIEDGELFTISDSEKVQKLNATLVIGGEEDENN